MQGFKDTAVAVLYEAESHFTVHYRQAETLLLNHSVITLDHFKSSYS